METVAPAAPVTEQRPVPTGLDKELENPGLPRASVAATKEQPNGSPNHDTKGMSVLQQHVEFFDRNKDGIIYPWETYSGFRALGFNIFISFLGMLFINIPFSYPSSPSWIPSLFFPIYIKGIHRTKHGSDTESYDTEGRFVPEKFEELFTKFDKGNKGGLTFWELLEMTEHMRNAADPFGWTAAKLEWGVTYWLIANDKGIAPKELIRATYDGSVFYRIEEERKAGKSGYAHKKRT